MARPLRLHAPGLLHHVFARGNNKAVIFHDDYDCDVFLDLLRATAERLDVHCVAYCLLWNHYHLLLVPHHHRVSRLMQQMNSTYCQRFNRRHGRVGHVLQGRFGCRIVEDGAYARAVVRYVALNPVAAGLVRSPDAWRWSSYAAALGRTPARDFLVFSHIWSAFGTTDAAIGRARLDAFVAAGLQEALDTSLLHGSDRLSALLASTLEPHATNVDYIYAHRFAARPTIGRLLDGCTDQQSVEDALCVAFLQHGYTLAELARTVGRDPSTICRWVHRAKRRRQELAARPSLVGDTRARNKI